MPPPTPPPGFTLSTQQARPPAPPPGFEISRTAGAPPPPPPGFTLTQPTTAAAAPPAPPPGFELAKPPGWIEVPEDPPIGMGDVLLDSLGQTASEWGDVFAGLPTKVSASLAKTIASMQAANMAELEQANAAAAELAPDDWRRRLLGKGITGSPEDALRLRGLTEEQLAIANEANQDLAPTEGATMLQSALESAAISAPPSAAAIATGLLTRNPAAAAATMYPTTAAQGFGDMLAELDAQAEQQERETLEPRTNEARLEDIARAQRYGQREGVLEVGTELLPMGALLKKGTPAVQRLAEVLLAELPGETLATLTQEINRQIALQPEGEATLDAVFAGLEEGGKQIPETLLASIIGSAGQTAPIVAGELVANRMKPRQPPPATPHVEPTLGDELVDEEAAPAPYDVEARAGVPEQGPPVESAIAPDARTPSELWRSDPAAGEGVPFAFLGETPEEAAGYLVEQNGKIDAFTAAGEQVGSFDGPDEAALALEDAIGVQTPTPAQGFGDEVTELGGAPVPQEAVAGEVVPRGSERIPPYTAAESGDRAETGFGDVFGPPEQKPAAYNAPGDEIEGGGATTGRPETPIGQPAATEAATVPERRASEGRRKPVAQMTPEELRQTILTHELTGIPNRRAYEEAPKRPTQTAVDVDSLKWINDNMGHDSGNELLKAVGEAIRAETDEAYHLSGDEFAIQADTPEQAAEIMERVNERLAGAVISVTMPSGEVVTVSGLGVSYGSGKNLSEADAALQSHKTEREARGQRAGRGQQPPGASRFATGEGREGDEGDAPAGAEAQQDRDGRPVGDQAERAAGEHVTLAGPFAKREPTDVDDVELADRRQGDRGDLDRRERQRSASTQDREVAIRQLLGKAKNAPQYRFVPENGLPHSVVSRMRLSPGYEWRAAFDPTTNRVWLNQDTIDSPESAAWYAMHEIAGHYGIKGAIGQLGAPNRDRIRHALKVAAQNPYIDGLAEAYRQGRAAMSRETAIEEALSELAAAVRTGNYDRLERAYGLEVPRAFTGKGEGKKPSWQRALDRFVAVLKKLFERALGYKTTDEQILNLIESAWRYVQEGRTTSPDYAFRDDRRDGSVERPDVDLADEVDKVGQQVEAILEADTAPVHAKFDNMIGTVVDLIERIDGKRLDPGFGPMAADLRKAAMANLNQLVDAYAERFGEQYDGKHAVDANKLLLADDDELAAREIEHGLDRDPRDDDPERELEEARRAADRGFEELKPRTSDAEVDSMLDEPDLATAYHGSPHKFDKFSLEHVGRGEGNQAYGWGLYLAESQGVAHTYRGLVDSSAYFNALTKTENKRIPSYTRERIHADGINYLNETIAEYTKRRDDFKKAVKSGWQPWMEEQRAQNMQAILDTLEKLKNAGPDRFEITRDEGQLYKVEIPDDDVARMLEQDRPLNKQRPKVRVALRRVEKALGMELDWDRPGRVAYNAIGNAANAPSYMSMGGQDLSGVNAAMRRELGDEYSHNFDANTSKLLAKFGIPGARYLDQNSRRQPTPDSAHVAAAEDLKKNGRTSAEARDALQKAYPDARSRDLTDALAEVYDDVEQAGTRNIVVFDDSIITITEINGKPVTPAQSEAIVERSSDDGVREESDESRVQRAIKAVVAHQDRQAQQRTRRRRGPRSPALKPGEQGELFTKEDARPGTNPKQLELANDLLREWADRSKKGSPKIRQLAVAFNKDFRADHTASLLGRNLSNAHDFALLAQTFRDPRYETLRYFFTDKAGKVIAETGVSSRLPGGANAWPSGASEQWLVDMFKRVKADGIRLLHNHPSGSAQWSDADLNITRRIAKMLGVPIEHVIVDSNEYSVIKVNADGSSTNGSQARVKLTELGPDKMLKPRGSRKLRPLLGRSVMGPREMVRIAEELGRKKGYVTIIGLNSRHDVRVIGDLRVGATRTKGELEEALHDFGIQNGSPALVVTGVEPDVFDAGRSQFAELVRDGYLLDVIDTHSRSLADLDQRAFRGGKTLGKIEAFDTVEVGSAKPLGVGEREERGERRKSVPAPAPANRAQIDLFDLQHEIETRLVDPKQTETSAFKRWFGKSKVVDENGKPLVVYHGTQASTDFSRFAKTSDIGFHFGTAKAAADRLWIANDTGESKSKWGTKKAARVIPAYLSIQNPVRLPDLFEWPANELLAELVNAGVLTRTEADRIAEQHEDVAEGDIAHLEPDTVRKILEAKGYDGIVYKNEAEGLEHRSWGFGLDDVEVRFEPGKAQAYVAYTPDGRRMTAGHSEEQALLRAREVLQEGEAVETDSWIALRPNQIKSAIANKGRFDPDAEEIDLAEEKPQAAKGGVQKISWKPGQNYVEMYRSKGSPVQRQPAVTMGTGTRADVIDVPKEPIRAQHVMELFQRLFKVKIYEGKPFAVRGALGFFRPSNFEVRNRDRNDLEVAAHEVFHWLDRTYPTIRKLYHMRRYADELKGVSYDTTKIFEGFAEFGRLFMTQETEAISRLPTFYEAFVKEARDAGILDKLEEVQRLMHQWYLQGAEARGRSKIGTSNLPIKQRLGKMADGFVDRAIASSLDQLQAAKVIERETRGDIAEDAANSAYKSMRLLQGARSTINAWLNHGTLKWGERGDLEFNGKGLRQIFEPIAGVFDEAMGYFVAMRATELRKYGKENLFSKDEAAALIERARKTGKLEQIQRAHEQYQQFTKRLTAFAVQSGILSAETKAVWEELYANYVPFYRVAEKFGSLDPRFTGGTRGGLFRKLYGGTANVADVFENITLNTALIVHASLKNVAKRQLFASIESSPVGQRYAVRIPESTEQRKVGIAQIERVLKEFAKEAAAKYHATPEADQATRIEYGQMAMLANRLAKRDNDLGQLTMGDVMSQARFFFTGNPPTIPDKEMVLVRGEPRWFQIGDPMLWDMLTAINYHQPIGLTEKVLGLAKRTLTRGVTITPEFQIANILRDTFNAFAMSKGKQWPIVDALKAMRDIWSETDAYKEFLANGGGFGNAIGDEAKRLRVMMKATGHRQLVAMPAELIDWWDKWGQSFELATRLAEYKKIRGQGKTRREAAFQGREISTDFAMRGHSALARWASISLAFFNARLQGLYRIERELNERRGRQSPLRGERAIAYATRALTGLTFPSLLVYWFLNDGDDDYEDLGEEIKSLNTVIPGPDGTQILIPRPFETGALFQEIPIRLLEYYRERDGDKLVNAMMFMLANTFNFSPWPQAVAPPIALSQNRQWNGLPIVPRNLENVEPREQFQPWTPDTYKKIGETFDVSPLKLQALVEGYFGTVGAYAIAASDALMTPSDTTGAEPSRRLSQYPLFRRFMRQQPYTNTQFEQRFYDLLDETTRVVDTARKLRREARADDLEAYLGVDERAALFAISGPTTDTMELAADLNAQMRAIRNDETLSAEQKRAEIDELQAEQNALFKAAVEAFDEALLEEGRRALGVP